MERLNEILLSLNLFSNFFLKSQEIVSKKPKLSIIVPNYNNSKYLHDCIESILNQTFNDFEIIIADDKSTDNSRSIIEEYIAKYPKQIRAIFNKKNVGVSANRHNAILKSKGRYITTLDSDDFYFSDQKLASELNLIKEYKKKFNEDMIAYSDTVVVNDNSEFIKRGSSFKKVCQGDIFKDIITRTCVIPRDFIMGREMYFEHGGYKPGLTIFEDWDLKIRLAAKYRFFYTFRDGTAYRHHWGGLSSRNSTTQAYWLLKIFISNCHLIPKKQRPIVYLLFIKMILKSFVGGMLRQYPSLYQMYKSGP